MPVIRKHLAELAARVMKPSRMDLGGHAPVIVFEDADVDLAVRLTAGAKVRNAGQIRIATTASSSTTGCTTPSAGASSPRSRACPLADPERLAALAPMKADEDTLFEGADDRRPNSRLPCPIRVTETLDGPHVTVAPLC